MIIEQQLEKVKELLADYYNNQASAEHIVVEIAYTLAYINENK